MTRGWLAVLVAGVAACSASPAMRAAENGDRASLRAMIAARESRGSLSNREAASLARAVAERELKTTSPGDGVARVRDALPCARELDGALSARMATHDAAGAAAALARLDARGWDLDDARRYAGDTEPAWRAVGARALVRGADRRARLVALVDGSPLVRREAVRAMRDAADAADVRPLSETARLDPEPIVRTEAVRAMASLAIAPAGEVADALRDLWTAGDDGLREDIALAWSTPWLWKAGGREALRILVATGRGPGAVEGAAAALRQPDAGPELASLAVGRLVRSIQAGARVTRLQAIAEAPLDRAELLDAVRAAAKDSDVQVRIGALHRLAGRAGPDARAAVEGLEALAQPGSAVGPQVRFALASAGDRRIQAWLEQDLTSPAPPDRLGAATALADLGVAARAAPQLDDDDPSVRVRAACTLLMANRVTRSRSP